MPDLSFAITKKQTIINSHKSQISSRYFSGANEGGEINESISSTLYYSHYLNEHESIPMLLPQINRSNHQSFLNCGQGITDHTGCPNSKMSGAGLSKVKNELMQH